MAKLITLDSISALTSAHADTIVVTGSHGGVSAARFVLSVAARPCAVFFNDAGVGKNDAGIHALPLLAQQDIAAATYSHLSACIGDAADAWANGVLSRVNAKAQSLGLCPGLSVQQAVAVLQSSKARG